MSKSFSGIQELTQKTLTEHQNIVQRIPIPFVIVATGQRRVIASKDFKK